MEHTDESKATFEPHKILEENTCDHAPFGKICSDCRELISAALEHLEKERDRLEEISERVREMDDPAYRHYLLTGEHYRGDPNDD